MKFDKSHRNYFNSLHGAYSVVTDRENFDSQITLTEDEASIVLNYFGRENILVGKVSEDKTKAGKTFLLYPSLKKITLNVIFPKPNKSELRLYIGSSKGFKPKAGEVWFIFENKKNEIVIGSLKNEYWENIESGRNTEMKKYESNSLKTTFNGIDVYTQPMKVSDVLTLAYIARRGVDKEEGAVQRVLNAGRIKHIREYILTGKNFFNTFILNWTENNHIIKFSDNKILVPIVPNSAQVLDGQHRLAGLEAAVDIDASVGDRTILVSFTIGLDTKQAAEIFLNINTEQRPVPKTLIYDLFGEVENDKEHAINRAKEISTELNENSESPYYKLIKFPGTPIGAASVDLSSFISTLKNYLKPNGIFSNYNITDLNRQKQIFLNYFSAIKFFYDKKEMWYQKTKNPFLQSSGVIAAIEFFIEKLLLKCSDKKSFSINTFIQFLRLDQSELLTRDVIKGSDGKSARLLIKEYLDNNLLADAPEQDEYEF